MPLGSTLRFDDAPVEDFLTALDAFEKDARSGYLPHPSFLREARIRGEWSPSDGDFRGVLQLFFLQETDPLSQRVEAFILFHTQSPAAGPLKALALRVRDALERRRVPGLFRIDPKYGLICGSASEPVDPLVRWDRPGCHIALYLTDDPGSPSLSVLEYVPPEHQGRFRDLFQRYNRTQPAKAGFLQATWQKLLGKGGAEAPAPRRFNYSFLRQTLAFLREEPLLGTTISLIYKDLAPTDARAVLLDPKFAAFAPSGNDRFFGSLGELT